MKLPPPFTIKTVKEVCSDELMPAKIAFFNEALSVCRYLYCYLGFDETFYQKRCYGRN